MEIPGENWREAAASQLWMSGRRRDRGFVASGLDERELEVEGGGMYATASS